jgi:hypothetical protein
MAKLEDNQIVETATEARQAERGTTILVLLAVSLGLTVVVLAGLYMVYFRA